MEAVSPNRKSSRVSHSNLGDPYPFAPLLHERLRSPPTDYGVLQSAYLTFLSRRHLHIYVLYLGLACFASAYLYRLEIIALSILALAWFFFGRPRIVVHAKAGAQAFNSLVGPGPSGNGVRFFKMASIYVAPTGFKDEQGNDIMGLYANQFIARG